MKINIINGSEVSRLSVAIQFSDCPTLFHALLIQLLRHYTSLFIKPEIPLFGYQNVITVVDWSSMRVTAKENGLCHFHRTIFKCPDRIKQDAERPIPDYHDE